MILVGGSGLLKPIAEQKDRQSGEGEKERDGDQSRGNGNVRARVENKPARLDKTPGGGAGALLRAHQAGEDNGQSLNRCTSAASRKTSRGSKHHSRRGRNCRETY